MISRRGRSVILVLLVGANSISVDQAAAQGSLADYQRAAGLRQRAQNKVFRDRVRANWLDDGRRFWYRVDIGPDKHRFMLVDTEEGKRKEAFDHEKLAKALADVIGTSVQPDQLPFRAIRFEDDGRSIRFTSGGEGYECNLDNYALHETSSEDTPNETTVTVLPFPRTGRRTGEETRILFMNRTEAIVKIHWINSVDSPKFYADIAPGERHSQHTFGGHVWLATDKDERPLGVFEAGDSPGVAVIDGSWKAGQTRTGGGGQGRRGRGRGRGGQDGVSPDGKWQASIVEHNVFLRDRESGEEGDEIRLTEDGTVEDRYKSRFYWSPDSRKLVVVQERPGQDRQVQFVESSPKDQLQPKLHTLTYAKPGDRIAHPRPRLFDITQQKQIAIPKKLFSNPWSITDLHWDPDSSQFTFLYNQRGHQVLRVVAVDAETGDAKAIVDEVAKTFVCYSSKRFLERLDDTGEIIWMSERDGWNHLYLYDATTGEVKNQITQGKWVVRGVDRVDTEKRQVWFQAGGIHADQDPYHVHYCRVNFDGSDLIVLTQGNGTHRVDYSPDGRFFIDTYSRVDLPPVSELRRSDDGSLVCPLETGDWSALLQADWQPPLRFVAKGRDAQTDIHGVIFRPTTLDPKKKYPVIENIYAGPHSAHVPKRFAAFYGSQELAELGFVVVRIDGMGTSHRSKAFHDICWKNLGDAGFPDRIAWMKAAAQKHSWMDINRVGIYGGSAGGQNAMRALIAHGDFYDAAVADCGCHDNRMDKIWWNEQWMGWPVGPHYEQSSNVVQAHGMQGKLMLFVGELDRNVDPASTMQVVHALVEADKDFDLIVLPGAGHGAGGGRYGTRRQRDFFVQHLLDVKPRWK